MEDIRVEKKIIVDAQGNPNCYAHYVGGAWPTYCDFFYAGGIYAKGSNLTIEKSIITNNTGIIAGGGITQDGGNVTINNSSVTNNKKILSTKKGGDFFVKLKNSILPLDLMDTKPPVSSVGAPILTIMR